MLETTPFAASLQEAVGGRMLVHPLECRPFAIAGSPPKLVVSPASIEEAALAAKLVALENESLVVRGAGTKSWRPPAPGDVFAVMDMTRCDGVVAYEPGDLTVTVKAGTKLAHLQSVLSRHGQFFPCDAPFAAQATIGGTLAAGAGGALRLRFGSARDNTLGLRVALSDGTLAYSGSKVVKSVAGYDAYKLFIGSLGTLGVIGEATLKVAPLPAADGLLAAHFRSPRDAAACALDIARSNLFVWAMSMHAAVAAARVGGLPDGKSAKTWLLLVRCGGSPATVRRQIDGAARLCKGRGALDMFEAPPHAVVKLCSRIAELAGGAAYPAGEFIVMKFSALPAHVAELADAALRVWPSAEISAHPALGIAYVHVPLERSSFRSEQLSALWSDLHRRECSVAVLAAPPAISRDLRVPFSEAVPIELQRRMKHALDPRGAFDPGRGAAGL